MDPRVDIPNFENTKFEIGIVVDTEIVVKRRIVFGTPAQGDFSAEKRRRRQRKSRFARGSTAEHRVLFHATGGRTLQISIMQNSKSE